MLDKFRAAKAAEIAKLQQLDEDDQFPEPFSGFRPSFSFALLQKKNIAVIAEYKRASPSKGEINTSLSPGQVAAMYAEHGAAALSVLTEETYFKGNIEYLERMAVVGLPLLRKDFILDPVQVAHTATTPASAVLFIARMFNDAEELNILLDLAKDLGLESVVEVFNESDLAMAREAGSWIIQVNNRDLDTLRTDLNISARLITEKKSNEVWISASGIETAEELTLIRDLGYNAALVGTSLMQAKDPGLALGKLILGATVEED